MDGCVRSMIPLTDRVGLRGPRAFVGRPERSKYVRVWSNNDVYDIAFR